ncbi:MAG: RluA family pseudouridine synthase [Treponema sp.]|nr:RluA family pseudouridine synthase [Treponema sp.]
MFPPFPQEKAEKICEELKRRIESGEIGIEQVTKESEERKNQGLMIGSLVCLDQNGREISIVTNSGISRRLKIDGSLPFTYAPPIVPPSEIEKALTKNDKEIHDLTARLKDLEQAKADSSVDSDIDSKIGETKRRRKSLCEESLSTVHALYKFNCLQANPEAKVRTLKEICMERSRNRMEAFRLPPTGTGECCAPKMLDYAIKNSLTPISMCEILLQSESDSKPIPPCDSRCAILLPAMLGLEILYRDSDIAVVNKQSGLLSVPGRITSDSVEERFRRLFPSVPKQPAVHRLDMETSGIMILAMNKEALKNMNMMFEKGDVQKEYVALLDGNLMKALMEKPRTDKYFSMNDEEINGRKFHGFMELYFRLDIENRPHQIWDEENGKKAVTEWEILDVERYKAPDGSTRNATRVLFKPHTGRTHQLRLASADPHGFGIPIIGDTLYGKCEDGERLMLHAQKITFPHPTTGEMMTIECKSPF